MDTEALDVNGVMIRHTIVPITGDGACLFRAISYLLYGNQCLATEIREQIVEHVVNNWSEFEIQTHDRLGNNYGSVAEYFAEMSLPHTYGSACELAAAGQIFPYVFEVYRNGKLYAKFGIDGNPVERLRFSQDLSAGHFDAYLPVSALPTNIQQTDEERNVSQTPCKRRKRFTDITRKEQRKTANKKYKSNNPDTQQIADSKYKKNNPEARKVTIMNYQKSHPEVHKAATVKYQQNNRTMQRSAQARYEQRQNLPWKEKLLSGMKYDPKIEYETDKSMTINRMSEKCKFCNALKWRDEAPGMCCSGGKVQLPPFEDLPEPLYSLIFDLHPDHTHFMDRIRKYNGCFQMTSFGANQVVENGFMPTFKVQGQVYHLVGSLLPQPQTEPQFLQIYFVGEDEREARLRCSNFSGVKPELVKQLQAMLHNNNVYIKDLKTTLDKIPDKFEKFEVVIHADRKPANTHRGRYNAPTCNEVGLVLVGQQFESRDIILQSRDSRLRRISEIHRSYDALQYPILFCRGEDGYSIDIPQCDPVSKLPLQKTVSALNFYSYRLMIRPEETNHILYCRSLLSMYLVDMYAKIETERLNFIRANQAQLRVDSYIHLRDAVGRQDADAAQLGQMIVLPSSFTGGPRYMHEKTQDAMTYVRHHGRPDLFITFTCNPRWKDIENELMAKQKPQDRHDIIARVFHLKVKKLMALLTKGNIFGVVRCFMYSVEWQKRGLPHIHILLWLEQRISPDIIDKAICAEIPDADADPLLHQIVKSNMIHGPCGSINPSSPCMKEGSCSKRFPRPLLKDTQTGDDGYPQYRRRAPDDGGFTVEINGFKVDNRWVVPYNSVLSRSLNAHINVEYCNSVKSIKYICKYVNKGSDQATFGIENDKDEVKLYESGRYISSSEAVWRILAFPVHERHPPVFHLAVHLENGQRVYFNSNNLAEKITNPPKTTLLAFFDLCSTDDFSRTLLYVEVPSYFVWKNNKFERRKRGRDVEGWPGVKKDAALGRVYTIHPNNSECYHLRLLLHEIRGPRSFLELKTLNGVIHPTFKATCKALGLLEDDRHWHLTLEEAALCDSPSKLRDLFIVMMVFCHITDAMSLWDKHKDNFSEDIRRQVESRLTDPASGIVVDKIYNKCLVQIEDGVLALGGQNITHYGLPVPIRTETILENRDLLRETSYDVDLLVETVTNNESLLTDEQKQVYEDVLGSIRSNTGTMFFLDAPGGTGKTFLINLILAKVRINGGVAIAVASSGIAATLLDGGKTAHSAFKLPLNLTHAETPLCNISKQSSMAQVLKECKLIVWDESTMAHRGGVEAVNRTLMDIRGSARLMGGVTVLLAGDFRQTLPVVPRGTRADEVKACIKKSYLWPHIAKLSLTKNMRVHLRGDTSAKSFSELLLKLGNGDYPSVKGRVVIPSSLGIVVQCIEDLTKKIYPDIANIKDKPIDWLCERAILTPKNYTASTINDMLMASFVGEKTEYKSVDSVLEIDNAVHYPAEFLNTLNPPGLPPHKLILKVGAPVMLLRNLKPPKLCKGTRLQIKSIHANEVEATVLTGCARGETVFVPRIPLIPSEYPFEFKRIQFPLKICFAMTINKAQGQSLKMAGIDLREDCFSHGQVYVACSRVSSAESLVILAPEGTTKNVVYKEVLT